MRCTRETVSVLTHPYQQLDQPVVPTNLFLTPHEGRIHLIASATDIQRAATVPMISALRPTCNSGITTLTDMVAFLETVHIGTYPTECVSRRRKSGNGLPIRRPRMVIMACLEYLGADDNQILCLDASGSLENSCA